jgi:hypothetical protein
MYLSFDKVNNTNKNKWTFFFDKKQLVHCKYTKDKDVKFVIEIETRDNDSFIIWNYEWNFK